MTIDRSTLTNKKILEKYILPKIVLGEFSGACTQWLGYHSKAGYGTVRIPLVSGGFKTQFVHRVIYALTKGDIPDGYHIDHLCYNPWCCNIDHLEAVTPLENLKRSSAWRYLAARDECKQGHPYTEKNTGYAKHNNARICKACMAAHARNRRARNKDKS